MPISRRNFLKAAGAAGVFGLSETLFPNWMPRMAFADPGTQGERDILVVIFQRGGMDGLNAIVPYGEGSAYYDRRPTIAIPEPGNFNGALDLDGFFGLHPALASLKELYDDGKLALIHGAGSPEPTRSHFDAMEYMERGTPGDKITGTGWITRHLMTASWQNESPFRAIGMGAMVPASLRGPVSALALRSIADFHLEGRIDQLATIQRTLAGLYTIHAPETQLSRQAAEVFSTIDLLKELSAVSYVPANGAVYPDSEYGMGLRQTAQLIKADVGLEVSCIDIGGWDTHDAQGGTDGQFAALLSEFGQGLAAFYTDMQDYMPNITVVTMSEFGRTSNENASGGTDHGRASGMFLMGGGVKSGIHTNWLGLHPDVLDEGDLAVTTDYRDILAEILLHRVKNPALDQIFPNYTPTLPGLFATR